VTGAVITRAGGTAASLVRLALARTGRARLVVHGRSMLPSIAPGSTVTIAARPFGGVRRGDVVAFGCQERIIVHRVTGRCRGCLVTLGDSMPLLDPLVPPDAYLGVVPDRPDMRTPALPLLESGLAAAARRCTGSVEIVAPPGVRVVAPPGVRVADPGSLLAGSLRAGDLRAGALCVGVSPAGVLGTAELSWLLHHESRVRILLGFSFGSPRVPGTLPPEAAVVHARLGRPWQQVSIDAAVELIGTLMTAEPGRGSG
jgi:hypothetical protein